MSEMTEGSVALARFREEAIEWAVGGRGQRIVDAAAMALADGLDSPSLRMLAGAPHSAADEEASELAPLTFRELGLDIKDRLSPEAYVDSARQEAQRLLDGVITERELARRLSRFCAPAGYPAELSTWMGLDDYCDLIDEGVLNLSPSVLDEEARAAAEELVNHRPSRAVTIGSILQAPAVASPPRRHWLSRILGRR
jgi:hypothetical protein